MKYVKYILAALLVALAFSTSYAFVGDSSDEFFSNGVESDLYIHFSGETRWVEVYEGSGGGSMFADYVRINLIDEGFGTLPHVKVYNNTELWMEFDMVDDEIAKVLVKEQENGTLIKRVRILDQQPDNFFSKARIIMYEPDCGQQQVPAVQPIGNSPYVGAIFTRLDLCKQKIILI